MAKIRLLFGSSAAGSVGGLTFQGSSSGTTILRSKPIPTHPKSPAQCANQILFNQVNCKYKNLTETLKNIVSEYPSNLPDHSKYIAHTFTHYYRNTKMGYSLPSMFFDFRSNTPYPLTVQYFLPPSGRTGFILRLTGNLHLQNVCSVWLSFPQSTSCFKYYKNYNSRSYKQLTFTPPDPCIIQFYNLIPNRIYFVKLIITALQTGIVPSASLIYTSKPMFFRCLSIRSINLLSESEYENALIVDPSKVLAVTA